MEEQKRAHHGARKPKSSAFPEEPQRDVLQFLLEHAPLENWERDVLGHRARRRPTTSRPRAMTKILNEGWACVTGDTLVFTDRGLVPMAEVVERGTVSVSDGEATRAV